MLEVKVFGVFYCFFYGVVYVMVYVCDVIVVGVWL